MPRGPAPYQCNLCGKKFWSYTTEARHRHNAPVLCKAAALSDAQRRALAGWPVGERRAKAAIREQLITIRALIEKQYLRSVEIQTETKGGPSIRVEYERIR